LLLASQEWNHNVEVFRPSGTSNVELPFEPFRCATVHLSCETYLSALILGGVFERHPDLRFGVIELCAHWIGPLGEQLDMWAEQFAKRFSGVLSMRPSEYIARNVRVTPFYFEPTDTYLNRYPFLTDVLCYSTDYPHVEGGKRSKQTFQDRIRSLDTTTQLKFFTTNGELLLPA
jgi:predicted TIM-barrel fold metal-dependent hydrolase